MRDQGWVPRASLSRERADKGGQEKGGASRVGLMRDQDRVPRASLSRERADKEKAGRAPPLSWVGRRGLLPQAELGDELEVAGAVDPLEVLEQAGPGRDHLEQAAAGAVVVAVGFEVLGEAFDSLREYRDLDLRRAGVVGVALMFLDDGGLLGLGQRAHI